jgi:KUP system potassium uptake protein
MEEIEEGSSNNSIRRVGTGSSDRRWVDGSEVDSETPLFSEIRDRDYSFGNLRRRLMKKPKRADSLDVEAMEIAGSHGHNLKVNHP